MDPTDLDLFRLAEQRLAWVDQRQRLLAQNVANANTPGYIAKDLAPFTETFAKTLSQTMPAHLAGSQTGRAERAAASQLRSPNGNVVSVEEQLSRVAETAGIQELVVSLHHRYQTMVRTALGRTG